MRVSRLLVVHDDDRFLGAVARWFGQRGFMVFACESVSEAISAVERMTLDAAIVGHSLSESEPCRIMRDLRAVEPALPTVLLPGSAGRVDERPRSAHVVQDIAMRINLLELEASVRRLLRKETKAHGWTTAAGTA